MNSNQSQVSGGNLQAGNGIEVYGHDFENNYNVLVNNGDINLALVESLLNERTYYGNKKINITERGTHRRCTQPVIMTGAMNLLMIVRAIQLFIPLKLQLKAAVLMVCASVVTETWEKEHRCSAVLKLTMTQSKTT